MPLSHDGESIVRGGFERYCRTARETDKASSKESLELQMAEWRFAVDWSTMEATQGLA